MNVKLLRKIQKHILAEPKRYNQSVWLVRGGRLKNLLPADKIPACKTVACIAGWACILGDDGKRLPREDFALEKKAARLLGLDMDEAERLFSSPNAWGEWPIKFYERYEKAKDNFALRAKIAVARIDHFIKTKGAE